MEYVQNFDEQNYDESFVDYTYIKETFRERERLVWKILTNRQSFVKFVRLFHHQLFALASYIGYIICRVDSYIKSLPLATAIHA